MTREEIIEKYGIGVCDAFGSEHCVGECQDTRDCGAKPIPNAFEDDPMKNYSPLVIQETIARAKANGVI
jgi:hypothetical protein